VADRHEDKERQAMARPAGSPSPLRIGELLVRRALIDPDDLALALSEQDMDGGSAPLGRLLVRLGAIDEDVLTVTLAEQSGMGIVDIDQDTPPEPSTLGRITREAAFRLRALPLRYEEGRLVVALAEPPTRDVRREILKLSGRQPDFVLANARLLADAIEQWYPHPSTVAVAPVAGTDTTIDMELRPNEPRTAHFTARRPDDERPRAEQSLHFQPDGGIDIGGNSGASGIAHAAVPSTPRIAESERAAPAEDRVVAWLLAHAAGLGASAVHLIEQPPELHVRARVDGRMRDATVLPTAAGDILVRRVLRAGGLDVDAPAHQSGWLDSSAPGFGPRVRVTTAPTRAGRTVIVYSTESPSAD
jgi:type II secretory ATPase GspE/PulE/Tfp pilus assembly ATPase PilB-like protein